MTKYHVSNIVYSFLSAVSLGSRVPKLSEKFRLDFNIDLQSRFYTKCITILFGDTGPSNYFQEYVSNV